MTQNRRYKIAITTACRSEYGLLRWIMADFKENPNTELQIVVTGAHLNDQFGDTYLELERDGFRISEKVPMDLGDLSSYCVAKSLGSCTIGIASALHRLKPDIVVVLGDRYELLAIVSIALIMRIPVAHISGGDITKGAIDNDIRNAVSAMSTLHFPGTEASALKLVAMGIDGRRVFNVGEPGLDNFLRLRMLTKSELVSDLRLNPQARWVLFTYHPETKIDIAEDIARISSILPAMLTMGDVEIIATYPNADPGSLQIINFLEEFAQKHSRFRLVKNLGQQRYLSMLQCSDLVVGNSSSIVFETPFVGVPALLIGDRQTGRPLAENIVLARGTPGDISSVAKKLLSIEDQPARKNHDLFGDGTASAQICSRVIQYLSHASEHC